MNKKTKQLKDLVFNGLDTIESSCKVALNEFESDDMSIDIYFSFLDNAKWSIDTDDNVAKDYANNYNSMLGAIKNSILSSGSLRITLDAITLINKTIKDSFMSGLKQ